MKIIKQGNKGKPWVGKKLKCKDCGCGFQLTRGDSRKMKYESDQRERVSYYRIKCPDCKSEQRIDAEILDKK